MDYTRIDLCNNVGDDTNNNFKIIQNKITLTSNESLKQIKDFLHDCKKTYKFKK